MKGIILGECTAVAIGGIKNACVVCIDLLFRLAMSTSYGFGVFDLVRSKVVYATSVTVPCGKFANFVWTSKAVVCF